jgi:hypothetical protein
MPPPKHADAYIQLGDSTTGARAPPMIGCLSSGVLATRHKPTITSLAHPSRPAPPINPAHDCVGSQGVKA